MRHSRRLLGLTYIMPGTKAETKPPPTAIATPHPAFRGNRRPGAPASWDCLRTAFSRPEFPSIRDLGRTVVRRYSRKPHAKMPVSRPGETRVQDMGAGDSRAIADAVRTQRATMDALFEQLRADGLDEPGVSRDPYGAGEQRAHATVARFAEAMGLEIGHDAGANLYMTLPGRDRSAPVLVIGSHLDS